jgi:cytochrome c553
MIKVTKYVLITSVMSSLLFGSNIASCKNCHGANFEKAALGKSKVVKDMNKDEIISTLKGYKDGTYGGSMKSIMVKAVSFLSNKDINALADEIKK